MNSDREHMALKSNGRLVFGKIRLAAVQAESAFIDLDRSTEIACNLIEQAAEHGAQLIGFPETFLPFFPNWYETLPDNALTRGLDKELFKNSVEVPGEHIEAVAAACKRGRISAVVGVNERLAATTGTMFNTQVYITRDGNIQGKHQKYVPTIGERQVHAPGRTGHYNAFTTDFGAVSALICGENSNPLGVYAAALHYPLVHVASWPLYFAPPLPMSEAILTATRGLAYSLKCFVINSVSRIPQAYIDAVAETPAWQTFLGEQRARKTGATILDPLGRVIADGSGKDEDLLFADVDLEDVIIPKFVHDFAGHYNRPELFAPLFGDESWR
jgi:nitrilase